MFNRLAMCPTIDFWLILVNPNRLRECTIAGNIPHLKPCPFFASQVGTDPNLQLIEFGGGGKVVVGSVNIRSIPANN